jgi:hypothetical protein
MHMRLTISACTCQTLEKKWDLTVFVSKRMCIPSSFSDRQAGLNSSNYSFKSHNMFSYSIHVSVRSSEEAPPRTVGLQTRYGQGAASVPRSGGFVAGDAIHILSN